MLPSPSNATPPHGSFNCPSPAPWLPMKRTQPAPTAATPPNRNTGDSWRRDRMQAACLSGCVTAHALPKHINLAASVTHRRLQVSKLCRCSAPKWQPNARLCAAETRRRDGRGPKTACSCHWLLWNAHGSKGRAASNDVSAGTSRRRCSCLPSPSPLLMATLSGCMCRRQQGCF